MAAMLANRLKMSSVTVVELGVAGGNGLLELERLSSIVGNETGLHVHPVGFDLGSGMPQPIDHRDSPYLWQPGFFKMDEAVLRRSLQSADLILGDVSVTIRSFMEAKPDPIGFLAFDLDFYSSTIAALHGLFASASTSLLPRVICYFDDTVGPHEELHSEFAGELLAITEFNQASDRIKLARINGLRYKLLPLDAAWVEGIYAAHLFDHPLYNRYVYPEPDRQFRLRAQA